MGGLIVAPEQVGGPFTEILRSPRVQQPPNTPPIGNVAGAAFIASKFLRGAAEQRVRQATEQSFNQMKNLSVINSFMQNAMSQDLTPEARSKLSMVYTQQLARQIQGTAEEGGKGAKKNPLVAGLINIADSIVGPRPKGAPPIDSDSLIAMMATATSPESQRPHAIRTAEGAFSDTVAQMTKELGRAPLQQEIIRNRDARSAIERFTQLGGKPEVLLGGYHPEAAPGSMAGVEQQFFLGGNAPGSGNAGVAAVPSGDIRAPNRMTDTGAMTPVDGGSTATGTGIVAAPSAPSGGGAMPTIHQMLSARLRKQSGMKQFEPPEPVNLTNRTNRKDFTVYLDPNTGGLFADRQLTQEFSPDSLAEGGYTIGPPNTGATPRLVTADDLTVHRVGTSGPSAQVLGPDGKPLRKRERPRAPRTEPTSEATRALRAAVSSMEQHRRQRGDTVLGASGDGAKQDKQLIRADLGTVRDLIGVLTSRGANDEETNQALTMVDDVANRSASYYSRVFSDLFTAATDADDEQKQQLGAQRDSSFAEAVRELERIPVPSAVLALQSIQQAAYPDRARAEPRAHIQKVFNVYRDVPSLEDIRTDMLLGKIRYTPLAEVQKIIESVKKESGK